MNGYEGIWVADDGSWGNGKVLFLSHLASEDIDRLFARLLDDEADEVFDELNRPTP